MITQDSNQTSLIEQTVNTFDSGIGATTATDGLSMIDQWLTRLNDTGNEDTDAIADTLASLRIELDTLQRYNRPDNERIADLLQRLIDQTQKVAGSVEASAEQDELSQLTAVLENLHRQVVNSDQ